jgi:hypothetical protein
VIYRILLANGDVVDVAADKVMDSGCGVLAFFVNGEPVMALAQGHWKSVASLDYLEAEKVREKA